MVIIALFEYAGIMYVIRFLSAPNKISAIGCLNLDVARIGSGHFDLEKKLNLTRRIREKNSFQNKDEDNEKDAFKKKDNVMDDRFKMAKSIDHASLILIPILFVFTTLVYWLHFAV